ncbi:CHAT domain-containing protein [Oscillochloris sp. ZM17-4]|uniref:CHAT domain-containing protein n=1 Tax=Oscillochloris sp. ZM17-4 TaxID=2866714 RepID=UPI001C739939|nr:CHAT domain-containing protein [Oscillochloris sp. ZM17-4]MBX0331191.1 CHAT domain-containing protein [Oscillochloris sp. ZM17-4]
MAASGFADLEIGLYRRDAESFTVELRYTRPDDAADIRLSTDRPALASFDTAALQDLQQDPEAYGKALSAMVFAEPAVLAAFAEARAATAAQESVLRLRLFLDPAAPELQSLRWETLRDPKDGAPLLMGERLFFSRFLSSSDWGPVRLRPQSELKALVVVANPANLTERFRLAAVDVPGELARARAGLGEAITITELASQGAARASLNAIIDTLRDGYDILYIVGHGTITPKGKPVLFLEDDEGQAAPTDGVDIVTRIGELRERPRLIVLASCESAGAGAPTSADGDPLSALGPRLARAGIPAVLAMQGKVAMTTIERFMPVFFRELRKDGQVDRAVAVARGAVRDAADHWMPVLYMRLRNGQIWYVPSFSGDANLEKWPALIGNIADGLCTPILGPQLSEGLIGGQDQIASALAEKYHFPMSPEQRDELPQVAQFLSVNQDAQMPRRELSAYMREEILRRYGSQLGGLRPDAPLEEVFAAAGKLRREQNPADPYQVLAKLPFKIYVTAGTDNLLVEALRAAGKSPKVEICRWNERLMRFPSVLDDPNYTPSPEQPLIFFLFGLTKVPDSLVLTEDDYFDYLIGVTRNKKWIPPVVSDAIADSGMLFLGFRMEEWSFRVLFRSVISPEGRQRRSRYANIAGQILPEEGLFLDPERARRYLETYSRGSEISVYWGSVDDFMQELNREWEKAAPAPVAAADENPFF